MEQVPWDKVRAADVVWAWVWAGAQAADAWAEPVRERAAAAFALVVVNRYCISAVFPAIR